MATLALAIGLGVTIGLGWALRGTRIGSEGQSWESRCAAARAALEARQAEYGR